MLLSGHCPHQNYIPFSIFPPGLKTENVGLRLIEQHCISLRCENCLCAAEVLGQSASSASSCCDRSTRGHEEADTSPQQTSPNDESKRCLSSCLPLRLQTLSSPMALESGCCFVLGMNCPKLDATPVVLKVDVSGRNNSFLFSRICCGSCKRKLSCLLH